MAAIIQFDQPGGAGTGTPGDARTGLRVGVAVQLLDVGAGAGPWSWLLAGAEAGSAATITAPSANPAAFTPDVPGSYLFTLQKAGGGDPSNTMSRVIRVTKDAAGLDVPNLVLLPAPGERRIHSTGIAGQGPAPGRGYAPILEALRDAARFAMRRVPSWQEFILVGSARETVETGPVVIGGRSLVAAQLLAPEGVTRTVRFRAVLQVTPGMTAQVRLRNAAGTVVKTLTSTSSAVPEEKTATLSGGEVAALGSIHTVDLCISAGTPGVGDRAICFFSAVDVALS